MGDVNDGNGDGNGNGNMGEPDAGGMVVNDNYDPITDDSLMAGQYVHYVSDTMIYTVIDDRIFMWNGTEYLQITAPSTAPGNDVVGPLGPYFHYVSDVEIYGYVGNRIARWNGAANNWLIVTDPGGPNLNLHPQSQFHYIDDNEIYAFYGDPLVGLTINMWNGDNWDTVMTGEPMLNLTPGGLHYVPEPLAIYATVGDALGATVSMYDIELGWVSMTGDPVLGLKPYFDYIDANNIHAVVDRKINQWNGTMWMTMVEDAPVDIAPYFHLVPVPTAYYAIGADGMVYKSK